LSYSMMVGHPPLARPSAVASPAAALGDKRLRSPHKAVVDELDPDTAMEEPPAASRGQPVLLLCAAPEHTTGGGAVDSSKRHKPPRSSPVKGDGGQASAADTAKPGAVISQPWMLQQATAQQARSATLRIGCHNANGLATAGRADAAGRLWRQLGLDVILVQETHLTPQLAAKANGALQASGYSAFWSHHTRSSAGVGLVIWHHLIMSGELTIDEREAQIWSQAGCC